MIENKPITEIRNQNLFTVLVLIKPTRVEFLNSTMMRFQIHIFSLSKDHLNDLYI